MVKLFIQTVLARQSVAVLAIGGRMPNKVRIASEVTWIANRDETQKLLPNIEKALKKAHIAFRDLDEIVVISGPGPYASIRIGVATANALAFCLGIKIRPIATKNFLAAFVGANELNQDSLAAIDLRKPAHAFIASGCEGKVYKIAAPIYFKPPMITKMKCSQ